MDRCWVVDDGIWSHLRGADNKGVQGEWMHWPLHVSEESRTMCR